MQEGRHEGPRPLLHSLETTGKARGAVGVEGPSRETGRFYVMTVLIGMQLNQTVYLKVVNFIM